MTACATMQPANRPWEGLNTAQADGLACVVCGTDYLLNPVRHVPVGRSPTGSQVFACHDLTRDCAAMALPLRGHKQT